MSVIIEDIADVNGAHLAEIQDAITSAVVTGSSGGSNGTEIISLGGEVERASHAKVVRVGTAHSAAWRVVESSDPALVGLVFVRAGQYASHAA